MWERGQGGVGCGEQEVTDLHIGASAGQHPFHDRNALHRQGWCAGAVKGEKRMRVMVLSGGCGRA